jgi:hypothetical protein
VLRPFAVSRTRRIGADFGFREGMRLQPEPASNDRRIDACIFPPSNFIAAAVHFAMMSPAQRHCELIAHLAPERLKLCKPEMVSVCGLTSANHARLLGDEPNMVLVPNAARL